MMLPGLREWVFSAKTFASAMLALYIALSMGLDRPYWAVMTVYVVSQPLTGAMRSKAVYRFVGTLVGAVAAIALVPNLVNAPVLLSGALALWVGVCIYFALLDRTPRSYLFLLAGFTSAIIGFPCVDAPETVFITALSRIEETTLAIGCTTLIGAVVLPRPLGPALLARIDAWFEQARAGCLAVLAGHPDLATAAASRRALAADAVEIRMLTSHLAYDTSNLHAVTRPIDVMERRILLLLPVLSSIGDLLGLIRSGNGISVEVQALIDRLAAWIAAGDMAPQEEAARLRAGFAQADPPIGPASAWAEIWLTALLTRMRMLADIVHDVRALRRQIAAGSPELPPLALSPGIAPDAARFHDHGMALLSGFATVLTVCVLCGFWIAAAWPAGGTAALMAAVTCSFFAAQDDPAPAILGFLRLVLVATAISMIYLFVILPVVRSSAELALVLAPSFLILGAMIALPATSFAGMIIAANVAALLSLTDVYNADFTGFVNNALATGVGVATAATLTGVVRSVGAAWSARRLMHANRRDIARVAARQGALEQATLTALMLDRLCELVPRVAASAAQADRAATDALVELRTGLAIVNLQRDSADLPESAHEAVTRVLEGVAGHFRGRTLLPPEDALRSDIDHAIVAVSGVAGPRIRDLLLELVGIRYNLFASAPEYQAAPGPAAATA